MLLERWDGNLAVAGVALVIAVGEPRCKFSQVAFPDWLTAQRTERLRAGCPAIHQDEFHMPPPHSVLAPGLVSRAGNKENSRCGARRESSLVSLLLGTIRRH